MVQNSFAKRQWKKSLSDQAATYPMTGPSGSMFDHTNKESLYRERMLRKRRSWWTVVRRTLSRCWSPEFSSRVLESQYWQCTFPQIRLRFRAGLVYIFIYVLALLIYFTSLYTLDEIRQYVVFSIVLLLVLLALFMFTFSKNLYKRLHLSVSIFCICLIATSCVLLFLAEKPEVTLLARFAISMEVILLIYTVMPVPIYVCALFSITTLVIFETFCVKNVSNKVGIVFFFYALVHMLGIHTYVLMQVRDRKTFLKVGQSLLARKDLEIEKEFKDRMIESVMPRTVAEELLKESNELKRPSSTPSDRVNLFRPFNMNLMHDVSILFADIVGFTKMSSNKSADELVNMLNDLFGRFDQLCGKCGCEKISTLGDCYYCVSGCPEPRPDHAKCCVEMGLSMIEAIRQFDQDCKQTVNMRVGIHTGTVLCGIVGRRRFKFDVFSNDVDLANLMESTGESGQVHVSESTAKFLDDEYTLLERPAIKGKSRNDRKLRTFFVVGRSKNYKAARGAHSLQKQPFSLAADSRFSLELRHIDSSDIAVYPKDSPRSVEPAYQPLNKAHSATNVYVPAKNPKVDSLISKSQNASYSAIAADASCNSTRSAQLSPVYRAESRNVTFWDARLGGAGQDKDAPKEPTLSNDVALDANGQERNIENVLSTHTASISRFEETHIDFDVCLAEAIRGSSLADGEYLIRGKVLNPFTLKFVDPTVEEKYRNHFSHLRDSTSYQMSLKSGKCKFTQAMDEWRVDAPKLSVIFDALIAITVILVLNGLALYSVGVSNAGFLVYISVCTSCVFAFLLLTAYYLVRHGTLPPVLVKWWPKHVICLLLINFPIGIMFSNIHCPAQHFSLIKTVQLGENYLIFICLIVFLVMFSHVNFSQIRSLPKSVSCVLIGICVIVSVKFCVLSCDTKTLFTVSTFLSSIKNQSVTLESIFNRTARPYNHRLMYNVTGALSSSYNESSTACFQTEVYIVVFLACLLIVFLNYQFEASFRMSFFGDMQACETIHKMQEMKDQADWLLSNIIPHHVVEHLARTSKYSENHDMVAVLFASIVNWNEMYEETYEGGKEFLRVLNELISDFDELLDRSEFTQVEKIKTIGPTYMAAAGLNPERRRLSVHPYSHLYQLMEFAIALQKTLENFNKDLLSFEFVMKIGYNIGPVTSGVIGTTKLYYDIWGDTVNISSRMYSTGVVGRIQVSRQAKEHLENVYDFEFREHISVKGVDEGMDVYLLVGPRQNMLPRVEHKSLVCDRS